MNMNAYVLYKHNSNARRKLSRIQFIQTIIEELSKEHLENTARPDPREGVPNNLVGSPASSCSRRPRTPWPWPDPCQTRDRRTAWCVLCAAHLRVLASAAPSSAHGATRECTWSAPCSIGAEQQQWLLFVCVVLFCVSMLQCTQIIHLSSWTITHQTLINVNVKW